MAHKAISQVAAFLADAQSSCEALGEAIETQLEVSKRKARLRAATSTKLGQTRGKRAPMHNQCYHNME